MLYFILAVYTINKVLLSVNRSNFILVFFKAPCHSNPGLQNKMGMVKPIYIRIYIPKVAEYIMYRFEHTNPDIHLFFVLF